MKISAAIDASIHRLMLQEIASGERAVTRGVTQAGAELKQGWRSQITGSGLGRRLANTVRGQTYPQGGVSLRAANLVWTRAPEIIDGHDRGALIRAKEGLWLAIPLPAAGKAAGGRRMTPLRWERKTGRALVFIFRRGRPGLLIDQGYKSSPLLLTKGQVEFNRRRKPRKSIPIFLLLPQTRLKKRLDIDGLAARAERRLPDLILSNWKAAR